MSSSFPSSFDGQSHSQLKEAYNVGFKQAELAKQNEKQGDLLTSSVYLQEAVAAFQHAVTLETDSKKRQLLTDEIRRMATKAKQLTTQAKADEHQSSSLGQSNVPDPGEEQIQFAQFYLEQALVEHESKQVKAARELYLEAAKWYSEAKKSSRNPSKAAACTERVKMIVETVEKMDRKAKRASAKGSGSASSPSNTKAIPHASSYMTQEEKEVLARSSIINGCEFLPWLDSDKSERLLDTSGGLFSDPQGKLKLSASQIEQFGAWKRPSQLLRGTSVRPRMIHAISHYTITQELVTDCSFVSSLCIAASYERRFQKQLITNIIYPQNRAGEPMYNPSGKYMVKLWFNGVARKVVVDDTLPTNRKGGLICSFSTNPGELWVSIIEKAYMKLNGGYDFPGSNSGIDLYALTGWIPETVHLEKISPKEKESTWKNLIAGMQVGDLLCTVATGRLEENLAKQLGLVPTHAYAVMDVREVDNKRLLQLKNPWAHLRWKGPFSPHDTVNWTPSLKRALQYDQFREMQFDNGIFWIDYDSLLRFFTGLYMNWNFQLLPYKLPVHRHWDHRIGPRIDTFNFGYNPQFSLEVTVPEPKPGTPAKKAVVWVVISRHVLNKHQLLSSDDADFFAVHVYDKRKGKRVYYPGSALVRGTYSNNPHGLVSFEVPPGVHTYTLVCSLYEKIRSVDFTLTAYTHTQCRMRQLPLNKEFLTKIAGGWTNETAGGSGRNSSFMDNPQWKVTLKAKSRILCRLEAPKDVVTNVRMCKGGDRVFSVSEAVEVASSGDYHRGFCYFESKTLNPGSYTLIPSTFEPGTCADFMMYMEASSHFEITEVPKEGAEMKKTTVTGAWDSSKGTAVGCTKYNRYQDNPWVHLSVASECTVWLRIQGSQPNGKFPSVNASVFPCSSSGGLRVPEGATPSSALMTTNKGIYSNPPGGTVTQAKTLSKGNYIVVPSTFKPEDATFKLIMYSSSSTTKISRLRG